VRDENRSEGDDTDAVGPVGDFEQAMVVDHGDGEHERHANKDEEDLLLLKAVELGHGRGGADFEHADDAQHEHKAE